MALNNPAPLSCQNIVSFDVNKTPNITAISGCNIGCRFCKCLVIKPICGKRGIRTPGTVARSPHFECGPIDHSGIFPSVAVQDPRVVRSFMILTVCKDNNFRAKKYSSSEKINIYPLFLCCFPPARGFAEARKPSAAAVRKVARRPATSAFGLGREAENGVFFAFRRKMA